MRRWSKVDGRLLAGDSYFLDRVCGWCDGPVPDDYHLYGYCPACVAAVRDTSDEDDD